jgi:hypothetical protein
VTSTAPRRAPTRRRAAAAFDQAAYEAEVEVFHGEKHEAIYESFAGLRPDLDLTAVYEAHAGLFSEAAIDGLRAAAAGLDAAARRAQRLLGFAVAGHLERAAAPVTDQVAVAEATAVVMWRRERIRYRQAPQRISEISDRDERNALDERYRMAMEAMNGLREERWTILHAAARALGAADYAALAGESSGLDVDVVAAGASEFLTESETLYFAALRRYLALIEIEGGDATAADLAYLLRGIGWDPYFEPGRLTGTLSSVTAGLGIDLARQKGITLDLEPRPAKAPRALIAPVKVPGDVRLVIQPGGGYDDYAAALHELGHLEHYAHVGARLAPADRYVGDASVTEGWAFLFQYLLAEPDWLAGQLRMPAEVITGWLDFGAFRKLYFLRRLAAKLLYELRLHRGGDWAVHRAEYAGLLGLLTGVITPDTAYLADVDDNLYAARYLRAWQFEATVAEALRDRYGQAWWTSADAGAFLRDTWRGGLGRSAEDVVASLGYDRLDWRPVLRQIRAQLIGEMSGYGGPNITTRAGSRKV